MLLVPIISGSIFQSIQTIVNDPTSIIFTLAQSLPGVSSFFISYIMLQIAFGPTIFILQISRIINFVLFYLLKGRESPRIIYELIKSTELDLVSSLSGHVLVATIGIVYGTLAPIVLIFVFIYFLLWSVAYKYSFKYVVYLVSF